MNINEPESLKPDLPALIDAHINGTHAVLADGCISFAPKLIIQVLDPRKGAEAEVEYVCVLIDAEFNDPEIKHRVMEDMGRQIYSKMLIPLSISLASECWMSNNREGIAPSQADDRREAINIAALGIDGSSDMQMMPFKRDKKRNIIEGPFIRYSEGKVESPLLESFYRGFFEVVRDKKKGERR